MIIHVDPKDETMYSVFLVFNQNDPDPEDDEVTAYLKANQLEPKREYNAEREGTRSHIMYFGGCYIRDHMRAIHDLHRKGVEPLQSAL